MKKLLVTLALLLLLTAVPAHADFKDVPQKHWAYQAIEEMVELGYLKGTGNGLFEPEQKITRAQFVQMLGNMYFPKVEYTKDRYVTTEPVFTKFGPNYKKPWYYDMYRYAQDRKLLSNMLEYDPNKAISRYDMAVILFNLTGSQNHSDNFEHDFIKQADYQKFDAEPRPIAPYLRSIPAIPANVHDAESKITNYKNTVYQKGFIVINAVKYTYSTGILAGMDSKGTFGGDSAMTRAQAAVLLNRLYKNSKALDPNRVFTLKEIIGYTKETRVKAIRDGITFENITKGPVIKVAYTPGKLANNKPITPENIQGIFKELQEMFPTDTPWGAFDGVKEIDYSYRGSVDQAGGRGCNAWVGVAFDSLYGTNAPYIKHQNYEDIRPGDMIALIREPEKWGQAYWERPRHWYTITATTVRPHLSIEEYVGKMTKAWRTSDGNVGGLVAWSDPNMPDRGFNKDAIDITVDDPYSDVYSFEE